MNELKCYFKKIHNQLDASFNQALRKYGLTCTQFDILAYLSKNAESQNTLTDISAHFGVRHTSVIHVLKILEKKELIYKSTSPDARAKVIALSERGQQIITEVSEKGPLLNEIMFHGLSGEELHLLEGMLKQIYENLESDAFRNF